MADKARTPAEDWITICQSEAAAMAADREVQEAWQRTADAWGEQACAAVRQMAAADAASRRAWADAAARPPAADATSGTADGAKARDAAIHELLDRVAALERRLADSA